MGLWHFRSLYLECVLGGWGATPGLTTSLHGRPISEVSPAPATHWSTGFVPSSLSEIFLVVNVFVGFVSFSLHLSSLSPAEVDPDLSLWLSPGLGGYQAQGQ